MGQEGRILRCVSYYSLFYCLSVPEGGAKVIDEVNDDKKKKEQSEAFIHLQLTRDRKKRMRNQTVRNSEEEARDPFFYICPCVCVCERKTFLKN